MVLVAALVAAVTSAVAVVGGAPAGAAGSGAVRPFTGLQTLPATDDGSTGAVPLGFSMSFFGRTYTSVFVNNNGAVTLGSAVASDSWTNGALSNYGAPVIAPFSSDIDTRAAGSPLVSYGKVKVGNRDAFVANWIDVGCYTPRQQKTLLGQRNSFQLVLIARPDLGAGTVDVEFNYDTVQWDAAEEPSDLNDGSCFTGNSRSQLAPHVGFADGNLSYERPGSGVPGAFLDGRPGALSASSSGSTQVGRLVFGSITQSTVSATLANGGAEGTSLTVPLAARPVVLASYRANSSFTGTIRAAAYRDPDCATTPAFSTVGTPGSRSVQLPQLPAGTYYVRAEYSGDRNYPPVNSDCAATVLTVQRGLITVVPSSRTKVFGAVDPAFPFLLYGSRPFQLFVDPSSTYGKCAVAVPHQNVGQYPITCGSASDPNYDFTYETATLTVTAATASVVAADKTRAYGEVDPTFGYTTTGGVDLTTEPTCGVAGPHAAVGTYAITCQGGVARNHTLGYKAGTLTVTPRPLTITGASRSVSYGDDAPTTGYGYEADGLLPGDGLRTEPECGVTGDVTRAGKYDIACRGADAGPNYAITYVPGTLTITRRPVAVIPRTAHMTYGDAEPDLGYDVLNLAPGDRLVTEPTCSVPEDHRHAGAYTIVCSGADAGPDYELEHYKATLFVSPRPARLVVEPRVITYGDTVPEPTTRLENVLPGDEPTESASCQVAVGERPDVGDYPVYCSPPTLSHDYTALPAEGVLRVIPKSLSIVPNSQAKTYGAADPSFDFTTAGLVPGDALATPPTCRPVRDHTDVGAYEIACSGAKDRNYDISYGTAQFVVQPATLTITAAPASATYGQDVPAFDATVTGFVRGDTLTRRPECATAGEHRRAGSYVISCRGADAGGNYTVVYVDGVLTVAPADLWVAANDVSSTYGQRLPDFTYTTSGLVGDDRFVNPPSCSPRGETIHAGDYVVRCGAADAGSDYTVRYRDATLTVTPATLTVSADGATKVYGADDPTLTSTTSGLVRGDALTSAARCEVAGSHRDVGSYPVRCSGADAGADYTVRYVDSTLDVTPANVVVTPTSASIVYGDADPAFVSTVTGLVPGDSLRTPAACTVPGAHTSARTYDIVCSGADAGSNYTLTYGRGTLTVARAAGTVTPAPQTITFGDTEPRFAYSVAGLRGSDALTTPPTCGVAGAHTDAGSYVIRCSGGSAGDNYDLDQSATAVLTVRPKAVLVTADDRGVTYGSPTGPFTSTATGLIGNDRLTTPATCDVAGARTAVGSYRIVCAGGSAGRNYTLGYAPGTLTVSRAELTVTAPSPSMTYGAKASDAPLTPTVSGLVAGDTQSSVGLNSTRCTTTAPVTAGGSYPAGSFPVACSGPARTDNYTVTYVAGTLQVARAVLTVSARDAAREFGAANPTLTATVSGLVNGDSASAYTGAPSLSTTATTSSPAGAYPITAAAGTLAAANYRFVFVAGTLAVAKATSSLVADPVVLSLAPGLLIVRVGTVGATLRLAGSKAAVVNAPITFASGGRDVCTATTDSAGVARCTLSAAVTLQVLAGLGVTARFAGNANVLPSAGSGGLVRIG